MKNSARGDSSTGSELKAVEEACREASRTVEPCELCVSVVNNSSQKNPNNQIVEDETMNNLPLTIGLSQSPITQALFDGSVRPNGIDLKLQTRFGDGLDNVGARHRAIIAGEIDGGELSISSYILARLRGVPLIALPVFLSRRFRLRCMYCRADSPLQHPSELAGKRATVHRYNATTPVWLKGILQNEFNVKPKDIEWYVAEPDIAEESLRPPPAGVQVNFILPPRTREHAVQMVEQGEIDAALEPYALHDNPKMRYLMPDFRQAEKEYFRRSGAYTTNHLFALREGIRTEHPWAVESLFAALKDARIPWRTATAMKIRSVKPPGSTK